MPDPEIGVAMAPMTGQFTMADKHVVLTRAEDLLVAVIDGVGHGKFAEFAAVEATRTLRDAPPGSLESLVAHCHDRLKTTRGVVMSLASLDPSRGLLTWLGVGNVAGVVFRYRNGTSQHRFGGNGHESHVGAAPNAKKGHHDEYLILRSGVVGDRLPTLHSNQLQLRHGDTLVFATDGVASEFDQEHDLHDTAQNLAERILKRYAKGNDDALVLVIRYQGEA
jgi:serine/threonine protein phosphatase PrpC